MCGRVFLQNEENTVVFSCHVKQRCSIFLNSVVKGVLATVHFSPVSTLSLFRKPGCYKFDPSGIFLYNLCPSILFKPRKGGDTLEVLSYCNPAYNDFSTPYLYEGPLLM